MNHIEISNYKKSKENYANRKVYFIYLFIYLCTYQPFLIRVIS